jgi:hypothetical protein
MNTFYATQKAGKSLRGNACCQLFVTDKGVVYVVPIKKESEVLQAVKQFAKKLGTPKALICNVARAQTSAAMHTFCNEIKHCGPTKWSYILDLSKKLSKRT